MGANISHWLALKLIFRHGEANVGEVRAGLEMDLGATTRLLDRLDARGLIERRRSLVDRRIAEVTLIQVGNAMVATATQDDHWAQTLRPLAEGERRDVFAQPIRLESAFRGAD